MPTSRNAKGIDIVIYREKPETYFVGIQVKSLSKPTNVPVGKSKDKIMGDYWIIINDIENVIPKVYILKSEDVYKNVTLYKQSWWLRLKHYKQFEGKWEQIGAGD